MLALQGTIKYTISKQFVSIMSKNCLRSFHCNEEIVMIHLIFIQTSKGQNNCGSFVAMRNRQVHLKMSFLVKNTAAHVQLD